MELQWCNIGERNAWIDFLFLIQDVYKENLISLYTFLQKIYRLVDLLCFKLKHGWMMMHMLYVCMLYTLMSALCTHCFVHVASTPSHTYASSDQNFWEHPINFHSVLFVPEAKWNQKAKAKLQHVFGTTNIDDLQLLFFFPLPSSSPMEPSSHWRVLKRTSLSSSPFLPVSFCLQFMVRTSLLSWSFVLTNLGDSKW